MTGRAAPPHHATDAVVHQGGGAGHQKDAVPPQDGNATAARAPAGTAAGPEIGATAPSPQVTTEATGIAVIPSPQKDQRRVTRRAEEEMNNFCKTFLSRSKGLYLYSTDYSDSAYLLKDICKMFK
uniref:Uncharacterized protein n=1 Tax=Anguilla anguilla TaxID=7936 RepID=A0A0E9X019_ANGAN